MLWASRKLGRPVKWTAERSESFMSDAHGRDHVMHGRAGARRGRQVPRRCACTTLANMGAYLSTFAPAVPTYLYGDAAGRASTRPRPSTSRCKAVFTNTVPVDAYRGAGRPEATYLLERLVDKAARELGIDRVEIRRKNFIQPDQFPYQTPVALAYDTGDYDATLDMALAGDRLRPASRRARGRVGEARQAARPRLLHLHRGLRHRAVGAGRRARRPRRPLRGGQRARPPHRLGDGLHRHPQPRPGARDDLRAGRRRAARHPGRERRHRPRRHRPDPLRHGHLRLALAGGRRLGDRQGGRQDHRQGQEDRRPPARGQRGRHRVQGRQVHRRRHRPREDLRRDRLHRLRAAQLPDRDRRAGPRGVGLLRSQELHLPRRQPRRRGRGRPRDRRRRGGRRRRRRRRRRDRQPDDRRRPDARRPRPGHRPGALEEAVYDETASSSPARS